MKPCKMLFITISILIITIFNPINLQAASNDFTASLVVSDNHVPSGTTIVSTITVTNTDNTYGADISISYKGQSIACFYLAAGKSNSIIHNVIIEKTTDIVYTVYASHGPDISQTKNTNIVTVYIEQTATPTDTKAPTSTPTQAPTPAPTYTPIPSETAIITPTYTIEIDDISIKDDNNTGWGEPISRPDAPTEILDDLFKISMNDWLGINLDTDNTNTSSKEIYRMRRLIFGLALLIVLSFLALIITFIVLLTKKK